MPSFTKKIGDSNIPIERRISLLGQFVDKSIDDNSKSNLIESISLGKDLLKNVNNDSDSATVNYFIANAYSGLRMSNQRQKEMDTMPWEDKHLENELIHLRYAFNEIPSRASRDQKTDLFFRIATNLGNALNHIGRFSEAVELWDFALSRHPNFAMALGNRGFGLYYYSSVLYDSGHQIVFLSEAKKCLEQALKGRLEGGARDSFSTIIKHINKIIKNYGEINIKDFSLGRSKIEKEYRTWALANRLFLNPLNDLGELSIAATDILTLPPIVSELREPPQLYGSYNQVKQEYVSARFLLFEGIKKSRDRVHFSDKKVLLYNTLDYPVYGISIEKVKIAFLIAYSVLDKIGFLLNNYLNLNIPERNIFFRTFWYKSKKKKKELRNEFRSSKNWPFRGLFWLSKDFYEKDSGFIESIEPNAKELNNLRNHIAHKYLKVHDELLWHERHDALDLFYDNLCYSIKRDDLENKTLKLIKLVRNALIYCALGVHCNEIYKKELNRNIVFPIYLNTIKDDWKI